MGRGCITALQIAWCVSVVCAELLFWYTAALVGGDARKCATGPHAPLTRPMSCMTGHTAQLARPTWPTERHA